MSRRDEYKAEREAFYAAFPHLCRRRRPRLSETEREWQHAIGALLVLAVFFFLAWLV